MRLITVRQWLVLTLGASVLSGCASITTGQDQMVSVQTPNCPAAACELSNKEGTYYINETPGTVQVNRVCGKMTVQCSRSGYDDVILTVSSSLKAMTFGNIIFGGLIGAGVDAATGAACEYPSLIPVPMNCGEGAAVAAAADHVIPGAVAESAEKLECVDLMYVGQGVDEVLVYTARCEGVSSLMSCDDDKCRVSEYATGSDATIGS